MVRAAGRPWAVRAPRCEARRWLPAGGARALSGAAAELAVEPPRDFSWGVSSHGVGAALVPTIEVSAESRGPGEALQIRRRSFRELQGVTGLHMNDLWSLHSARQASGRVLLQPRGHCLLVHLGPIRAVLQMNRCLLFNSRSSVVEYFSKAELVPLAELPRPPPAEVASPAPSGSGAGGGCAASSARAFEIDCLECILAFTSRRLRRRADCFTPTVQRLLHSVASETPEAAMVQLLSVSRSLVELEQICNNIVTCLEDVLRSEDEMLAMMLTERSSLASDGALAADRHEVVETLLESYLFVFKSISDQLFLNNSAIEKAQTSARITLEQKRTRLLALNAHVSIATLSLGVVAAMGGLLGMNVPLPPWLAENAAAFPCLCAGAGVTAVAMHSATVVLAMQRPDSTELKKMYRARQLVGTMPELADLLLKRLESYSMIANPSEPDVYLSFKEFQELVCDETGRGDVNVETLREMFNVIDHNGDGRIQIDDIAEFLCVITPGSLDSGTTLS